MLLILKSKSKNGPRMQKFVTLLGAELKKNKTLHSFSSFEETELFLQKNKIKILVAGKPLTKWNSIYARKVGKNRGLAHIMAQLARKMGIFFADSFHNYTKDSSDTAKIVQMFRLASAGISIPKTYFAGAYTKKHLRSASLFLKFPIVVKECNTSQGAGVFLAKNFSELKKVLNERLLQDDKKETFLQEFIPNDFEYRILITGDKIGVAEKKIRSRKDEFRNNVHLGAKEEFIDISAVPKKIRAEAILAAKTVSIEIAGVDIVEQKNGNPIIFEVNSCPAFTLNSKISPEIKNLAKYLSACEKK